jgi:hypothetical protein
MIFMDGTRPHLESTARESHRDLAGMTPTPSFPETMPVALSPAHRNVDHSAGAESRASIAPVAAWVNDLQA